MKWIAILLAVMMSASMLYAFNLLCKARKSEEETTRLFLQTVAVYAIKEGSMTNEEARFFINNISNDV